MVASADSGHTSASGIGLRKFKFRFKYSRHTCMSSFLLVFRCCELARQRFLLSSGAPSAVMSAYLFLQLEYKAPTAVGRRFSRALWQLHRLPCPKRLFQG